jgi:hypothetical protein
VKPSAVALLVVAVSVLGVLGGCADNSTFAIGLDPLVCEASIPTACNTAARCSLDSSHYISGMLPGSQKFIVRTDGVAQLKFEVLLADQRSPGSVLSLTVHESNCSAAYNWDNGGRDIFRIADVNGVVTIPISVMKGGDHLVEMVSDAYCSYTLKVDIAGPTSRVYLPPLRSPQKGAGAPEDERGADRGFALNPRISQDSAQVVCRLLCGSAGEDGGDQCTADRS